MYCPATSQRLNTSLSSELLSSYSQTTGGRELEDPHVSGAPTRTIVPPASASCDAFSPYIHFDGTNIARTEDTDRDRHCGAYEHERFIPVKPESAEFGAGLPVGDAGETLENGDGLPSSKISALWRSGSAAIFHWWGTVGMQSRQLFRQKCTLPALLAALILVSGTVLMVTEFLGSPMIYGNDGGEFKTFGNLRLCPSSGYPFVQGTIYDGQDMARITVFDAEVLRGVKMDKFEYVDDGAGEFATSSNLEYSKFMALSLLAFVEDDDSIKQSYEKGWGSAHQSALVTSERFKLTCNFWRGHSSDQQLNPPDYSSSAVILSKIYFGQNFFSVVRCPLPDGNHIIHSFPDIQVQLSMQSEDTGILLYLPTLLLCNVPLAPSSIAHRPSSQNQNQSSVMDDTSSSTLPPLPSPSTSSSPSSHSSISSSQIGLCVRPFHLHSIYTTVGKEANEAEGHVQSRVKEFLDYNYFIGVEKVFFYDRFGDQPLQFTRPYEESGLMEVVPFPTWSEVYYRRKTFNNAHNPYSFPACYDQLIHFEHCFMMGRRMNVGWTLLFDTDEFLRPENVPVQAGFLTAYVEEKEEEHKNKGCIVKPLKAILVDRVQFVDGLASSDSVLASSKRCRSKMMHQGGINVEHHSKSLVHSKRALGGVNLIHAYFPNTENDTIFWKAANAIIHHYYVNPKGDHGNVKKFLCHKAGNPKEEDTEPLVEDTSLVKTLEMISGCKEGPLDSCKYPYCGHLCRLIY